jgi:hypothetical protein
MKNSKILHFEFQYMCYSTECTVLTPTDEMPEDG